MHHTESSIPHEMSSVYLGTKISFFPRANTCTYQPTTRSIAPRYWIRKNDNMLGKTSLKVSVWQRFKGHSNGRAIRHGYLTGECLRLKGKIYWKLEPTRRISPTSSNVPPAVYMHKSKHTQHRRYAFQHMETSWRNHGESDSKVLR